MEFVFFIIGVGFIITGHWIIGLIFIVLFLFAPTKLN